MRFFSYGAIGFIEVLENLGPRRLVIATAGHAVDDAPWIKFKDSDSANT